MTTPVAPSPATARRLRQMRRRLTLLLSALAVAIVAVFTLVVLRVDADLRDERIDAALLRKIEAADRAIAFDGQRLTPADPTRLLDDDVAVAVRPAFEDVVADTAEQIPEPDEDELFEMAEFVLDEFEDDDLLQLLESFRMEEGTLDERREVLLEEFPDDLRAEAYRMWVLETADDLVTELAEETLLFRPEATLLDDEVVRDLAAAVIDDGADGRLETEGLDGRTVLVQARALRDGVETRGAVVAAIDLTGEAADERDFRTRVILLAVALVAGGTLAAWILAGRSIRPTAVALAQQERFLADAAHELRTPIAAIRATAEAPLDAEEVADDRLARVSTLAAGASRLTDDLLTLARMDADRLDLDRRPTRVDLLVEQIVDDDPAVRLELAPLVARIDPGLTERVIRNLLDNARAHGAATPEQPVVVAVDGPALVVSDQGPGVSPELAATVFERFRSGPASRGHGLGLPLARWIARAQGGDLTLEPGAGGATFRLRLPTASQD